MQAIQLVCMAGMDTPMCMMQAGQISGVMNMQLAVSKPYGYCALG